MPALESVQSGSLTITSGSGTTVNVTISSVDVGRSIVMFTFRSADVNYRDARHLFRADLSSSTNLRLIRHEAASATSIELYWTVVEFDSAWGGSVQTGSVACDADPEDITISAVDLSSTFPLLYHSTDDFQPLGPSQPCPEFSSTTNLRINFASAPSGTDCTVNYQVVEFDAADAAVQSGVAIASNSYSNDDTISAVDVDKTLVLAWSDIVAGAPNRNYSRTYLASSTAVEADSQNRGTAPNWNNFWFAVEMLDGSVVESGVTSITNGNTAPGTAPSWGAAMTNGAVFHHKSQPNSYVTTTANDSLFPNSIQAAIALDSPQDSVTVTRHGTANDIEMGWQVIEWGASGGATTITGAGNIASAEAFGSTTVAPGAVSVTPSGIASAEAFGTAQLNQTITGAGNIASAEAFGSAAVVPGAVTITGAGAIASAEAFGDATVTAGGSFITGAGAIASAEAFGSTTVVPGAVTITGAGAIATAEAFGDAVVSAGGSVITGAGAIATAEAFGTHTVAPGAVSITGAGAIVSAEAFGTAAVRLTLLGAGAIASAETFGSAALQHGATTITGAGNIATGEAFGDALIPGGATYILAAGGIVSAEAFGPVPLIPQNYTPTARILEVEGGSRILEVPGGDRVLEVPA